MQRSSDSEDDDLAWLTIDHWHVFLLHRQVRKPQQLQLWFHWRLCLKHIHTSACVYVRCHHQAARLLFVLRRKWLQLFFKRMSLPSKLSSPQDEAVVHCLVSVRRTQSLCIFNTSTLRCCCRG